MRRKRPVIPMRVKMQVVLRQDGKCGCGCGERLGSIQNTEFDHCPPLQLREYDVISGKYTPDANDPEKIVARTKEQHRTKTSHPRGPHTSIDSDQHAIAKARRSAKKFVVNKLEPGTAHDLTYVHGNSFPKGKRSMAGARNSAWKRPLDPRKKPERRHHPTIDPRKDLP